MNALARHLQDISQPRAPKAAQSRATEEHANVSAFAERVAYERGVEDALTRAGAMIEQALSAANDTALSVKSQWTAECHDRVRLEAASGRSMIESRLSTELVNVLSPFIEAKQREKIRESFVQFLREEVVITSEVPVKLYGPADEREIMIDCLGELGITAMFYIREGPTMDAQIGPKIIRADFASWSRRWLIELGAVLDVPT